MSLEVVKSQRTATGKVLSGVSRVDASRSATALRAGFAALVAGARRIISGAVIVDVHLLLRKGLRLSIDVEGLRALHTLLGFNLGLLVFVVALSFLEDGKELLAGLDNLAGVVNNGDCLFERHVGQRCRFRSPALSRKAATR